MNDQRMNGVRVRRGPSAGLGAGLLACVSALMLLPASGCDTDLFGHKKPTPRPAGTLDKRDLETRKSIANEGTIGAISTLQGVRLMRVKGYGLVTGLAGKGSSGCPPSVREAIAKEIRRMRSANPHAEKMPEPDALIDSLDTAVVEVVGEIPAGAEKGRNFDVFVTALDENTLSLAGGMLLPCDLKLYQEVSPAKTLEGRTLARAGGPVFLNPFHSRNGSAPGNPDLTSGRIIGGGLNQVKRGLRLVTINESYAVVRRMADAINRRFEGETKTADPTSPTNVELTVPTLYRGRESRFLEIVFHIPLMISMADREARAKSLVGELARPDAPPEDVALALEAMGKSVIPLLQNLYTHERRAVNYHAARTGVRLGHDLALDVIIRHANDERSPFRASAIRELGDCAMPRAGGQALEPLLSSPDPRIRILAYESLRRLNREVLKQVSVGEDPVNFWMEEVPSDGRGLIYARRTNFRRIGLIGGDAMTCRTPLFYANPGSPVTLTAAAGDQHVTVIMKVGGRAMRPFQVPLSVPVLVQFLGDSRSREEKGRLKGLGLDYSVVLDVLYRLCESGAIDADLKWEEPSVEDLVGPLKPLARPESDL